MGEKSAHIPVRELRAVVELIAEAALWRGAVADRDQWLTESLARLTNARVATVLDLEGYKAGQSPTVAGATDVGWDSDSEREAFLTYIGGPANEDPLMRRFVDQPGAICTYRRQDLLEDLHWYGSAHYGELRNPARVDHCMYSTLRLDARDKAVSFGLHRPTGDRSFSVRERALLDLVTHGLRPIFESKAPANPIDQLPPRLRRVALELNEGHGAKQIATRLGLSRHTVYSYCKDIYRALGVMDRQELQALAGRYREP